MSENLSQKAYWHIHDKLTSGALEPGFRLSNRAVAREVGISFTPVREALNRLVSEGLLEYREGLGVLVPQANHREIKELYEVREMLECEVVARVCGRLPEDAMQQLHELHRQMQEIADTVQSAGWMGKHGEEFRQLDTDFHLALIRGVGNRQLLETMTELRSKCVIKGGGRSGATILVDHVFQTEPIESVRRTCREHDSLLALLADAGGAEEARRLMKKHIRTGCQLALAAFDQTYMDSSRHAVRPGHSAVEEAAS